MAGKILYEQPYRDGVSIEEGGGVLVRLDQGVDPDTYAPTGDVAVGVAEMQMDGTGYKDWSSIILSASAMDAITLAWLRYRLDQKSPEGE